MSTQDQRDSIYRMFFGPYEAEWRDEKGIVDNRDSEIAKRLNLNVMSVSFVTERISREHFENIVKLNNKP